MARRVATEQMMAKRPMAEALRPPISNQRRPKRDERDDEEDVADDGCRGAGVRDLRTIES